MRIGILTSNFIPYIEIIMDFWSQKLFSTYYPCLESTITSRLDRLFFLTLALKTRTCVMALFFPTLLKLNPNMIGTTIPYRLPMGSLSWIGSSTIQATRICPCIVSWARHHAQIIVFLCIFFIKMIALNIVIRVIWYFMTLWSSSYQYFLWINL